jgi:hypothetical protein
MAYSLIQNIVLNPGTGLDLSSAAGNYGFWASVRPATLLGFGIICTLAAAGTETTDPIVRIQVGPQSLNGVTFADVPNFTMTPTFAAGLKLGAITEVSALLKAVDPRTGVGVVAPSGYVASFDLNAGDVAALNINRSASFGTTQPKAVGYILVSPRGS